jgi:hypothetical protein
MTIEIPEENAHRRRTVIVGFGVCLVLILAGWGAANSKRFFIWIQTRRMNSGWKEHYSQPEIKTGNLIGYEAGEAWERYERAREALCELGAYRRTQYQFQVLMSNSRERSHLTRRLILSEAPGSPAVAPSLYWELSDAPSGVGTMTIWGRPEEVEALLVDLKTHDVADYGERFRRPEVLAEAQDCVNKWPALGMWLPKNQEVDFFRKHYDVTREILSREIHNNDKEISRTALYVVRELMETARDLGPDLVEILASDPTGEPNLSVVRALTGVRYRSPQCQSELNRQWNAVVEKPDLALTLAAAQYAISESAEERQRAENYITQWLQPMPDELSASERTAYLDTQLDAVMCVKLVPGFKAVEAPLERLLKNPIKLWMTTQIPDALSRIRRPVVEAQLP